MKTAPTAPTAPNAIIFLKTTPFSEKYRDWLRMAAVAEKGPKP